MCECGCASNYDRFFLPGPDNMFYMLEFSPGCRDCETPAGVIVSQRPSPAAGCDFCDKLPMNETRGVNEIGIGIAEPGAIADLCINQISHAFGVNDPLDWPESFTFDPDEFRLDVYRHVAMTLSKSVACLPDPLCNCNPEEQTGGGHHHTCPAFETECTCLEAGSHAGHEPGCSFYGTTER
jgi:hypothetical protein